MYVFIGLSGLTSRLVMSVCCDVVSKEDFEAISRAYEWVHDRDDFSAVEIWHEGDNCPVVRFEVT